MLIIRIRIAMTIRILCKCFFDIMASLKKSFFLLVPSAFFEIN